MLRILVVEDDAAKAARIVGALETVSDLDLGDIEVCSDVVSAKRLLAEKAFDVLILDICLPNRFGQQPQTDGGTQLLRAISESNLSLHRPFHIIGLTQYEQSFESALSTFEQELWALLRYDQTSADWSDKLVSKIQYLVDSNRLRGARSRSDFQYDLAIVCALRDVELGAVLRLPFNWTTTAIPSDSTIYHIGQFNVGGETKKVVACCSPQMGMPAAAVSAMKLVSFFSPRYLVMAGICAGIRDKTSLGDVLVPDLTWDYGSGRIEALTNGELELKPNPQSIPLLADVRDQVAEIAANEALLFNIRSGWLGHKPNTMLRVHIGPFASGAAVVADQSYVDKIVKHNRKLVGLDMETYAVFFAAANCQHPRPKVFAVKAVSDFADSEKSKEYQPYAAYASATLIEKLLPRLEWHSS
jgi:nucleoside phosphorylase/CheY-like chemotaxis protein